MARCWIVQHRAVHPRVAPADWTNGRDYPKPEPAQRFVDTMREQDATRPKKDGVTVEWRVVKVTQRVVY